MIEIRLLKVDATPFFGRLFRTNANRPISKKIAFSHGRKIFLYAVKKTLGLNYGVLWASLHSLDLRVSQGNPSSTHVFLELLLLSSGFSMDLLLLR